VTGSYECGNEPTEDKDKFFINVDKYQKTKSLYSVPLKPQISLLLFAQNKKQP